MEDVLKLLTWIGALFLFLLIFWLMYIGVSWIVFRVLGIGVIHRFKDVKEAHLTFDDGPHPDYTPALLKILEKEKVKATFFVVGSFVREHPETLRRVHEAGHEIGLHNERHIPNWLMWPPRTARELFKLARDIERITGEKPALYRPPWGILGLWDYVLLRRHFRIILWSIMPRDWEKSSQPKVMKWRILNRLGPGEIVLLHDSGRTFGADPTAPERMLTMLPAVFETLKAIKSPLRFVPIGASLKKVERRKTISNAFRDHPQLDMWTKDEQHAKEEKRDPSSMTDRSFDPSNPEPKSGVKMPAGVRLYFGYERLLRTIMRYRPLAGRDGFLFFQYGRYKGPSVPGLNHGDPGLVLHLNNVLLFQAMREERSDMRRMVALKREAERALRLLTYYIAEMEEDVQGCFGYTALYRGVRPFGFRVYPMARTPYVWLSSFYLKSLLALLHPQTFKRLKEGGDLTPHWTIITREELMERYGEQGSKDKQPLTDRHMSKDKRSTSDNHPLTNDQTKDNS